MALFDDRIHILDISDYPGVALGTLASDSARVANRTAIQAAVFECYAFGKKMFAPPGRYEIAGGPVNFPYSGFRFEGTTASDFVQFSLDKPVWHLGAPLGTPGVSTEKFIFDGFKLSYAGVATGRPDTQVGGNALEATGLFMGVIRSFEIGDPNQGLAGATSVPYRGVLLDGASGTVPCFSVVFDTGRIKHCSYRCFDSPRPGYDAASTGIVWTNIYLSGGDAGGQRDMSTIPGAMPMYLQMHKQPSFRQLNIEWVKAPCALTLQDCNQFELGGVNLEGISLKQGSLDDAGFIDLVGSRGRIGSGLTAYDNRLLATNNVSKAALIRLYDGSCLELGNYGVENTTKQGQGPFAVFRNMSPAGNRDCRVALTGELTLGYGHGLDVIEDFQLSAGNVGAVVTQHVGYENSVPMTLPSANETLYAHGTPGLLYCSPSGGPKTKTMSKYHSQDDIVSLPRGVTRTFVRDGGTDPLILANHSGTALATLNTVGASAKIAFDGNNWRLVSVIGGSVASMEPFGLGTHQNEASKYAMWAEAGVQWLRMDIPWSELEPTQGTFNWGGWDNAINTAESLGLRVLFVLGYTPAWARPPSTNEKHAHLAAYEGAWETYVSQVVNRYGDRAVWEVWNEPDLPQFLINNDGTATWANLNFPNESPTTRRRLQYKRMVDRALAQAGLASRKVTTSGFGRGGQYDVGWMDWLVSQGAWLKQFSICSHHLYGWENSANPYWHILPELEAMTGFGSQVGNAWECWATEHGIATYARPSEGDVSDKRYLIRSYALYLGAGGRKMFWFHGGYTGYHQDMLTAASQRTAVFYAYQTLTSKWKNPVAFSGWSSGNARGTIATLASGVRMAVVWCDTGTPALNTLGLSIASAWNQDGTAISASSSLGASPVFLQLTN